MTEIQTQMGSFRISDYLLERIKLEYRRRKTNFSSFMRDAASGALRNRTYHGGDTVTEVTSAKSNALPFEWWQQGVHEGKT
jgi:hypothetical protein